MSINITNINQTAQYEFLFSTYIYGDKICSCMVQFIMGDNHWSLFIDLISSLSMCSSWGFFLAGYKHSFINSLGMHIIGGTYSLHRYSVHSLALVLALGSMSQKTWGWYQKHELIQHGLEVKVEKGVERRWKIFKKLNYTTFALPITEGMNEYRNKRNIWKYIPASQYRDNKNLRTVYDTLHTH